MYTQSLSLAAVSFTASAAGHSSAAVSTSVRKKDKIRFIVYPGAPGCAPSSFMGIMTTFVEADCTPPVPFLQEHGLPAAEI